MKSKIEEFEDDLKVPLKLTKYNLNCSSRYFNKSKMIKFSSVLKKPKNTFLIKSETIFKNEIGKKLQSSASVSSFNLKPDNSVNEQKSINSEKLKDSENRHIKKENLKDMHSFNQIQTFKHSNNNNNNSFILNVNEDYKERKINNNAGINNKFLDFRNNMVNPLLKSTDMSSMNNSLLNSSLSRFNLNPASSMLSNVSIRQSRNVKDKIENLDNPQVNALIKSWHDSPSRLKKNISSNEDFIEMRNFKIIENINTQVKPSANLSISKSVIKTKIKLKPLGNKNLMNANFFNDIKCNISEKDTSYSYSYSVKTQEGMYRKSGERKINQDNYLIADTILEIDKFSIFAIFDGHGINGHFISSSIKSFFYKYFTRSEIYHIPRNSKALISGLPSLKNLTNTSEIYEKLIQNDYKLIREAFKDIEEEIKKYSFDKDFSGSTVCLIFLIGTKLICVNIGDSRSILITCGNKSSMFRITQLSNDHKPDNERERLRIEAKGGVVRKCGINLGPSRVWVKDQDYPGLAMSRSIGDFIAKTIGVISDPEVLEFEVNPETKFIVMASDGIWDHLSNEQVANIISKFYCLNNLESAIDFLIKEVTKITDRDEKDVDDITIIVIYFDSNKSKS